MFTTLNTEGFLFTQIEIVWSVLKADFGAGLGAAALVGAPGGTRTWTISITALPDSEDVETKTRAAYLWQFYRASKAADDAPFWIEVDDPATGTRRLYLARFTDHKLSYEVLCAKVYGNGLNLAEARVLGTVSPVPVGLASRIGQ
jgi:hypothetical protein